MQRLRRARFLRVCVGRLLGCGEGGFVRGLAKFCDTFGLPKAAPFLAMLTKDGAGELACTEAFFFASIEEGLAMPAEGVFVNCSRSCGGLAAAAAPAPPAAAAAAPAPTGTAAAAAAG